MRKYLLIFFKLTVSISLIAFLYRKTPLEQIGGLLIEGPTGTNVNDFRAILVR